MKETYRVINKFQCCGKTLLTVIMYTGNLCVIEDKDYKKIIEEETRYMINKTKIA